MREVALEAIERARRGDGPTLIEAETYRFRGHSLADPDELRSKEEKAKYMVRAGPAAKACSGVRAGPAVHLGVIQGLEETHTRKCFWLAVQCKRMAAGTHKPRLLVAWDARIVAAHVRTAQLRLEHGVALALLLMPCVHVWCLQARDPIPQLKTFMLEQGLATEDDIKAIHDR